MHIAAERFRHYQALRFARQRAIARGDDAMEARLFPFYQDLRTLRAEIPQLQAVRDNLHDTLCTLDPDTDEFAAAFARFEAQVDAVESAYRALGTLEGEALFRLTLRP